jgi:hypothetical protein
MILTLAMIPTAVIIARVVSKLGHFRWGIWSRWAITILGTSLLILLDIKSLDMFCREKWKYNFNVNSLALLLLCNALLYR